MSRRPLHHFKLMVGFSAGGGKSHAALLTLPRHLDSMFVRMHWLA